MNDSQFLLNVTERKDVPEHEAFWPWRLKLLDREAFRALAGGSTRLCEEQLEYLAWFGVLAPTTHNSVPQRFKFDESNGIIEVWLEKARILGQSDREGRQAVVSVGCVIESIVLAAKSFGLRAKVEVASLDVDDVRPSKVESLVQVAKIKFFRGDLGKEWISALVGRKVVRAEYDDIVVLPSRLVRSIEKLSADYPPVQLKVFSKKEDLFLMGKFDEQAMKYKLEDKRFVEELGRWMLPNGNVSARVGMRGREFGMDDKFSQKIHEELLGRKKIAVDQLAFFARGGREGIRGSSAVCLVNTPRDDVGSRIMAGRCFLRVSLELWQKGFVHAVHAGGCEVGHVRSMIQANLLRSRNVPMVLFRVGKTKKKEHLERSHSSRPRLKGLVLS